MTNIDLVIFDCDGVLIDSEPIASQTLADTLQQAGIPISAEEVHLRFTGYSVAEIQRRCVCELGLQDAKAAFATWNDNVYAAFEKSLKPMPGITTVVETIQRPKCVASNSSVQRLQKSLGLLALAQHFAPAIFSADMVANPKPAPDLPLFCAEKFGARPAHCVLIDDNAHGVFAAIAAGMMAIGFVDPADTRPERHSVLTAAGARFVVTGAEQLLDRLADADRLLAR